MTTIQSAFNLTLPTTGLGGPEHAVRGLIRQALWREASEISIGSADDRLVLGHNGTVSAHPADVFQVTGDPLLFDQAEMDLLSVLNPQWSHQVHVTTERWTLTAKPGPAGPEFEVGPGEKGVDGVWFEVSGLDLESITEDWVHQCMGFCDATLTLNQVRQPEAARGRLVLETEVLAVHVYPVDDEVAGPAGIRSLGHGWECFHLHGESQHLAFSVREEAMGVLDEVGRSDLKGMHMRLQVVVKEAGEGLFLMPGTRHCFPRCLNQPLALDLLKDAFRLLPAALDQHTQPLMAGLEEGLPHGRLEQLCQEHGVPMAWADVQLERHGWRQCMVLKAREGLPVPDSHWHQRFCTHPDATAVLSNNLLRFLGEDRLPATLLDAGDSGTLQKEDLTLLLSPGQVTVRDHTRVRGWLEDPSTRDHLLMNVAAMLADHSLDFLDLPPDLSRAHFVLGMVLS